MSKTKVHWVVVNLNKKASLLCGRRTVGTPLAARNKDEITCVVCNELASRWNLKPRSAFPKIPTFRTTRGAFRCPCCGERHSHGMGDGHRVSHCGCFRDGGYYIKEQIS
jgi:hypothetical protein